MPPGLIPVPLGKSWVLLLTPQEFTVGVRRGKWWRRREALWMWRRTGQSGASRIG